MTSPNPGKMPETEIGGKRNELHCSSPLAALFTVHYRKLTCIILLFEVIGAICVSLSPLAQKFLIDAVTRSQKQLVWQMVIAVAVLYGAAVMLQTLVGLLHFRLGVEARNRLKPLMFRCLLSLPENFIRNRGSGYFFNRLQCDTMEVMEFFAAGATSLLSNFLKFVFALVVISSINWRCMLALLPFLLIQSVIYYRYRKRQRSLGYRIQECSAKENFKMQEFLSGHTTLKTHDAEARAVSQLQETSNRWRQLAMQRLFHENHFRIVLQLPQYVIMTVIWLAGLYLILDKRWSLGQLWALLLLVKQVFAPAQSLTISRFRMQNVSAAWKRLRQIHQQADNSEETGKEKCGSLRGDVVFDNVDFAYQTEQPLLQNLSFTVRDGSLFFLTGKNGSGKSTVFLLLMRLFDQTKGTISIGGKDVRRFSPKEYRSHIGYLDQFPEFFPGSIRENLLLNNTRSDAEIMEVLKMLKSEELVTARPEGLDAKVAERGENFSGGERLRLALTRELLRDTDLLLLDEPAASLDAAAKKEFYNLLPALKGHRTVMVIAHDALEQFAGDCKFELSSGTEEENK